jgi:hypothetical protein
MIMKKIAIILGSLMIMGAVAVNAQEKPVSKPAAKSSTQMHSKKAVHKKSSGNYHMNKKSMKGKTSSQPMENNPKVKSKGKPVY